MRMQTQFAMISFILLSFAPRVAGAERIYRDVVLEKMLNDQDDVVLSLGIEEDRIPQFHIAVPNRPGVLCELRDSDLTIGADRLSGRLTINAYTELGVRRLAPTLDVPFNGSGSYTFWIPSNGTKPNTVAARRSTSLLGQSASTLSTSPLLAPTQVVAPDAVAAAEEDPSFGNRVGHHHRRVAGRCRMPAPPDGSRLLGPGAVDMEVVQFRLAVGRVPLHQDTAVHILRLAAGSETISDGHLFEHLPRKKIDNHQHARPRPALTRIRQVDRVAVRRRISHAVRGARPASTPVPCRPAKA